MKAVPPIPRWLAVAAACSAFALLTGPTGRARAQEPAAAGGPAATAPAADTLSRIVPMPEVVVTTTRADARAPIARSTLTREQLRGRNWGQDTPMALASLPGAYAYSDAGNGIGYSYLSIRGFPQRRIGVLINGVPLNDPESHEVYWIDHPDLLASSAEVQMQRGVGSALYGAASVGGSVNLETSPFGPAPAASATLAYGSYDTRRAMLEGDSGPLPGGWNLYGRYSRIETDGYRDRSDTELWSYTFAARRQLARHTVRLNLYGGPEETHLAYLGVPQAILDGGITGDRDRDRRFNPLTYDGERDHFFEPHYELIHSWSPREGLALTQTTFYFDGEGYYDERRFGQDLATYRLTPWATNDTLLLPRAYYRDADGDGVLDRDGSGRATVERFDLVRRRTVQNRHYGWIPRARLEHDRGTLTVGGELRAHDGRHFGQVLSGDGLTPGTPPDVSYYDYHPRTLSAGLFAREEWRPGPSWQITGDLAWRHQDYRMRGDRYDGVRFDQAYDFALPRLGLTWTPRSDLSCFVAWAQSRREPAFRDLYDAEGVGSVPLIVNGEPLIRPERVNDYELGAHWERAGLALDANAFWMEFADELVYAGQFNTDLGYPIIGNAARSRHRGLELSARRDLALSGGWSAALAANGTVSWNAFREYREVYGTSPGDTVSYDGNTIGFFPGTIANLSARVSWHGAMFGLEAQHVGRIYLDNTERADASIGPRAVLNLSGGYRLSAPGITAAELSLRLFNVLDRRYATGGYMDYDASGNLVPHFIPAATRNTLVQARVEF